MKHFRAFFKSIFILRSESIKSLFIQQSYSRVIRVINLRMYWKDVTIFYKEKFLEIIYITI